MKTRILMIAALVVTTMTYAQKKEVKALEKAVKSGSYGQAKTLVAAAEGLTSAMDTKTKEKFLLLKAQAFLGVDNTSIEDLQKAAQAYTMLKNTKYDAESVTGLANTVAAMVNSAVEDQNTNNYIEAGEKLKNAYEYSDGNKDYLFYSATNYLNGRNYDTAADIFQQLLDEGYQGQSEAFFAVNAETGEKKSFTSKQERDVLILSKEYINPTTELSESRESTIINYLIAIYAQNGENDKALGLLDKSIAKTPNDTQLLTTKANIYLKENKIAEYKELIAKVVSLDGDNPLLYFNLGVSEGQLGNKDKAREYYIKATELKPDYADAYNNIAALILEDDQKLLDEMNSLGNSNADYDRFDKLKAKRLDLYKDARVYLEQALEIKPDYLNVAITLRSIYEQLGETSLADAMKAKIETLEAGN
jgi:tetratricopeptide (TPR) repeat protein